MNPLTEKIVVLLVFAMALLFVNLKAGTSWLKAVTLWPLLAAFAVAGFLAVQLVLA